MCGDRQSMHGKLQHGFIALASMTVIKKSSTVNILKLVRDVNVTNIATVLSDNLSNYYSLDLLFNNFSHSGTTVSNWNGLDAGCALSHEP